MTGGAWRPCTARRTRFVAGAAATRRSTRTLVGIPAGAEVRATAAVRHLWPQLSDGSVVVSRAGLESRIAMEAGIDGTEAKRWVEVAIRDRLLEPMGDQVAWRADAQAERFIAAEIRRRMASGG